MSAITAKASRKMKKYAVLTREPRCFLGSFDFSWEQRKAIDIADYSKGNGYSKGDLTDVGTPIILYGRLYTKYQFAISEVDTFAVPRNGAVYSQGNEVIVPASGETAEDIARASAVEKSGVLLGGDLNILKPFDFINPLFLALAISNGEPQKELAKKAQGKSVVHIHNTDIQEVTIAYPSNTEQDRIVSVFRQLDNLITLHQRKCANLCSPSQVVFSLLFATSTFSWEQRKLEDYLTVSAEKNTGNIYGRSDVLSVSGDYGIVNQIEFQGRSFAGASVSNYGVVQTGDVVYTKSPLNSNPYGIIKTNKGKPGIVSTLYAVYHPKENAFSDFIQVYFEQHARMNNYMHPLVNKGAKNDMKVSAENALKGPVCFPSRIEQESISAFFSVLDNLITLHQRECISFTGRADRLILTANKKRTTSSWEQRKLGEMGQTYTGLSGKTKDDFGHGQARFVTYMNVFSNPISNPEMTEPIEIDPKQNEVEVGDVFFTTSSETPEEVGMSSILLEKRGKTYLNSFCFGFRPSEKIDSYYLAYMLRSESTRAKIILLAQGISRYNISKNKVMEIAVSLPSLDEQKMIGQYFSQLDNLITLHQRKPFLMKWRTSDANRNQTNRLVL